MNCSYCGNEITYSEGNIIIKIPALLGVDRIEGVTQPVMYVIEDLVLCSLNCAHKQLDRNFG